MVDELELLKKDWKKQEASLPKVTAQEIYPMLLKKSSSIVKWIFIISIIEFVFWIVMSTAFRGSNNSELNLTSSGFKTFETIFLIVHASVLLFFILKFYKNFKNIKSTDSASQLMQNILSTRKTVKYFILTSLALFVIAAVVISKFMIDLNPDAFNTINSTTLIASLAACLLILGLILWTIYNKVYGILLKRLTKNYKELEKIEI